MSTGGVTSWLEHENTVSALVEDVKQDLKRSHTTKLFEKAFGRFFEKQEREFEEIEPKNGFRRSRKIKGDK